MVQVYYPHPYGITLKFSLVWMGGCGGLWGAVGGCTGDRHSWVLEGGFQELRGVLFLGTFYE